MRCLNIVQIFLLFLNMGAIYQYFRVFLIVKILLLNFQTLFIFVCFFFHSFTEISCVSRSFSIARIHGFCLYKVSLIPQCSPLYSTPGSSLVRIDLNKCCAVLPPAKLSSVRTFVGNTFSTGPCKMAAPAWLHPIWQPPGRKWFDEICN